MFYSDASGIDDQSSVLAHQSKIQRAKSQQLIKGAVMKKLIAFLLSLTCIPLALAAHNDKEVDLSLIHI